LSYKDAVGRLLDMQSAVDLINRNRGKTMVKIFYDGGISFPILFFRMRAVLPGMCSGGIER